MQLDNIRRLVYLERFVNNGSPTGFTFTHSSSDPSSPLYCSGAFRLPFVSVSRLGTNTFADQWEQSFTSADGDILIPIHPDIVRRLKPDYLLQVVWNPSHYRDAEPTASPRTVIVRDDRDRLCFVKLDYPRRLGRFASDLRGEKLWIGPRISQYLSEIDVVTKGPEIYFLPEVDAVESSLYADGGYGGTVLRRLRVVSTHRTTIDDIALVPAFSLFGENHLETNSEPLLIEMLRDYDRPVEVFLNSYIVPVLQSYWFLSASLGIIPEAHSQNLLFGFMHGADAPIIVWRDFQGFYRDGALINSRLNSDNMGKYHLIDEADPFLARKRRSFLYDWVLGHYLLDPLIACCLRVYPVAVDAIEDCIRNVSHYYLSQLDGYLPNTTWYSMPLTAPTDQKLEMFENQSPRYR